MDTNTDVSAIPGQQQARQTSTNYSPNYADRRSKVSKMQSKYTPELMYRRRFTSVGLVKTIEDDDTGQKGMPREERLGRKVEAALDDENYLLSRQVRSINCPLRYTFCMVVKPFSVFSFFSDDDTYATKSLFFQVIVVRNGSSLPGMSELRDNWEDSPHVFEQLWRAVFTKGKRIRMFSAKKGTLRVQPDVSMKISEYHAYLRMGTACPHYPMNVIEWNVAAAVGFVTMPNVINYKSLGRMLRLRDEHMRDIYPKNATEEEQKCAREYRLLDPVDSIGNYCMMSQKGCQTDFHYDVSATSVCYNVKYGSKKFCIIPYSKNNLRLYEKWNKQMSINADDK
jgi:hypothetical protein